MMDLHVQFSEVAILTLNHPTVTSNSTFKPQPLQCPVAGCDKHSMGHIHICHNIYNYNQYFNSGAVDYYGDKSKSHPKDLHKEKLKDLIGIFQHVSLRTLCSTILQLILFLVCFCGAYGKSKQNTPCQLMFVGQLYSDKLLLKCFYNGHCKGTLKWTGGKSGTKPLFNVKTSPTEKVRFIDGKGEKWFGMQIKDWNREDIEAHYKCWFGFSKLIVNIVNRAVLNKPFDDDLVKYKCTNGENNLILNAKVLHTNRQSSFTAFIQDQNITKHLTSIKNPKKNGSWFETRIKLNLKLTEEDNNKTFMLLFRENIIIKEIINTTLCRETDTREGEREPMTTMNTNIDTDDTVSRKTQTSNLTDSP